jgi:hypothetical protein
VHQRHRDMDPGQGSWRLSAPGDRCPIVHIFDADSERKWITWLWIEHVFHHGSMWLPLGYGPSRPSGRGRGLRYDAVARSTGPGGAVPQIRSCHLAIDLATDQYLTPA